MIIILGKWLNIYIQLADETLSGTTNQVQSGPGINSNEGVLKVPQSSSTEGTSLQRCSWCILQPQPIRQP